MAQLMPFYLSIEREEVQWRSSCPSVSQLKERRCSGIAHAPLPHNSTFQLGDFHRLQLRQLILSESSFWGGQALHLLLLLLPCARVARRISRRVGVQLCALELLGR